jgi:aryl-alcohol dehydrogenase-like predicted oxidoreductase
MGPTDWAVQVLSRLELSELHLESVEDEEPPETRASTIKFKSKRRVEQHMGGTMKYTSLGRTGVHVSLLALGAMTFGSKNAWKLGGLDQDAVNAMVKRSIDAGVNFFDTADVYDEGESEMTLGRALAPYRDQVILATKVRGKTGTGINEIGLSRHHIRIAVRKSLERLGTSWIDLYQFHGWDPYVPLDESIVAMQDLIEEGLVNYPGISNFSAWQMATVQGRCEERGYSRYETAQMNYDLLNRDLEHEILPFLRFSRMTLLVWSPLHGGLLSGKYTKDGKPPTGTRMGNRGFYFPFFDESTGWTVIDKVREIAVEQGCTPAQVALAWLFERRHVVLLGVTTMKQIEENLGAVDVHLSPKQAEQIDAVTKPRAMYPGWMIERQSAGRAFPLVEPE